MQHSVWIHQNAFQHKKKKKKIYHFLQVKESVMFPRMGLYIQEKSQVLCLAFRHGSILFMMERMNMCIVAKIEIRALVIVQAKNRIIVIIELATQDWSM